jgi:DtxR family Mn-dependent transcriptional regulator
MTPELAIEELAEEIGTLQENGDRREETVLGGSKVPDAAAVLDVMVQRQLVHRRGGEVRLTPAGEAVFRAVIRRHRLAEVLLSQVLQVGDHAADATACQFEHLLSEDVTDSICTFLGHPPTCPHGKAIPRGDCCASFQQRIAPLVRPVRELPPGSEGRIVFIHQEVVKRFGQLAALGIVPGTTVRLLQRHPSPVVAAGETTVALDDDIAAGIYVRPAGSGGNG